MTLNSRSNAWFALVLAFALSAVAADAPKMKTVSALAKVHDRTRQIDGENFHLIAVQYDWRLALLTSDSTATVWLINGRRENDMIREPDPGEAPVGKLPTGARVVWMKIPDEGNIELLFGAVHLEKKIEDPAELRKRMIDAGYVPFTIEASKTQVIREDTAEGLGRKLKELSAQKL